MKKEKIECITLMTLCLAFAGMTTGCSVEINPNISSEDVAKLSDIIDTNTSSVDTSASKDDTSVSGVEVKDSVAQGTEAKDVAAQRTDVNVTHTYEPSADNSDLAKEVLTIEPANGSAWTYKSKELPVGQYDHLLYVTLDNSIAIIDQMTLHLMTLDGQKTINDTELSGIYNGGSCKDSNAFYINESDGSYVAKIDFDGNIVWEVDLSSSNYVNDSNGGGYEVKIEGDVLHCYYEYSNYDHIDIKTSDGSFVGATPAENN